MNKLVIFDGYRFLFFLGTEDKDFYEHLSTGLKEWWGRTNSVAILGGGEFEIIDLRTKRQDNGD